MHMKDEITSLLAEYISFKSIAGENESKKDCLRWVQKTFMSETPYNVHTGDVDGAPYVFLEHPAPELIWFAHADVVPGSDEQFNLIVEGDKAIGRGAKDMKGATIPFLMAYRDALAAGVDPKISILITSDEEVSGHSIPNLIREGIVKGPVAFTPDTGSSPWIVTGHKALLWVDLVAKGKVCHSAMPWMGDNPITKLTKVVDELAVSFGPGTTDDWQITVTPTSFHSGTGTRNQLPPEAKCGLDIRYPIKEYANTEEVIAALRKHIPSEIEIEIVMEAEGLDIDPDLPMVQMIKGIAEDVLGKELPIGKEHGGTDARFFASAGIPAFLYGPYGENLHGTDEWMSISSMEDHYEISKRLLERL